MADQGYKRKLTAIMSADVKGYSRLMGLDDEGTVRMLTAYRNEIFTLIQIHHGRVVDSPGDNILAEFASIVDAIRCSVKIQKELETRNTELPEDRRMRFRIGINLGDVISEDDRIYGDGVNVAARIEGLADPGGVCLSESAFQQAKNKLSLGYEFLDAHAVKNIPEPVSIYRVLMKPEDVGKVIVTREHTTRIRRRAAAVVSILAIAAVVVLSVYFGLESLSKKAVLDEGVQPSQIAKPSIAVLPLKNLGGDPEQEYFSDGITNDIITDLSKFRELSVIASNTVFTYKDEPVKVKTVSQELGVQYVLEGSVQKIGNRLRFNAQLIDANTDHHLWAERYDRNVEDLFELQSEIVQTIVSKLAIQIETSEYARVMQKRTDNLKAYDYLIRGHQHIFKSTRKGNRAACRMFQQAIEIDPGYSTAYAALAWSYINDFLFGWTVFPNKSLQMAQDLAEKAVSLDRSNSLAHSALGYIYVRRKQYDLATGELRKAIELNPNDSQSQYVLGSVMLYSGRREEAIFWKESALRLNPRIARAIHMTLAQAYYLSGRYDDAMLLLKTAIAEQPEYLGNYIIQAAVYAQAGLIKEAQQSASKVMELDPFFRTESFDSVPES